MAKPFPYNRPAAQSGKLAAKVEPGRSERAMQEKDINACTMPNAQKARRGNETLFPEADITSTRDEVRGEAMAANQIDQTN
jgi:hypothetical protein